MLEDFKIRVFLTVVKERSFTKASEVLDITQPAVSQNIAELEKSLGVKLFERLRKETALTDEGRIFLRYAERHAEVSHEVCSLFAKLPESTVRISSSEELYNHYIEPRLSEFMSIHPNVRFERVMFGDADLRFSLRPFTGTPFDTDPDVIARMRISLSAPVIKMGGTNATHEESSYFEVLFQAENSFSCTRLCRLVREFLTVI